jgi:DinB family protein
MNRNRILSRLQQFPDLVRDAIASVGENLWRAKTAATPFALIEHAWHLADLEQEGFGARIERILAESNPYLPDFAGDEIARLRRYIEQPMMPALLRFRAAREANLARLSSASETDWPRKGTQEFVGEITLEGVLKSMLRHDIAHANEIVELLQELGLKVPEAMAEVARLEPLARSA